MQIRAIVRNRTGIEDWILEKANHRLQHSTEKFVFPYDLGVRENIKQVLNMTCEPVGDGVVWNVAEGCDQYTLTVSIYFMHIRLLNSNKSYKFYICTISVTIII